MESRWQTVSEGEDVSVVAEAQLKGYFQSKAALYVYSVEKTKHKPTHGLSL